jgi:hypothetical protein
MFLHASPAAFPPDGRRATVLNEGGRGVPTLQLVVAEAVAVRLGVPTLHLGAARDPAVDGIGAAVDHISTVPLSRWDVDGGEGQSHLVPRFGAFLQGEHSSPGGVGEVALNSRRECYGKMAQMHRG